MQISLHIINITDRQVYLFWKNSDGIKVKYGQLPPRTDIHITTRSTRLWIVKDAKTGFTLRLNGEGFFLATCTCKDEPQSGEKVQQIFVTIPVFGLQQRCMETVFLKAPKGAWNQGNIPWVVRAMLGKISEPARYIDYHELSPTICEDLGG